MRKRIILLSVLAFSLNFGFYFSVNIVIKKVLFSSGKRETAAVKTAMKRLGNRIDKIKKTSASNQILLVKWSFPLAGNAHKNRLFCSNTIILLDTR